MYNLAKDIFNPKNWLKLILNPSKIITIYERIFYYPGLKFGYLKSNLYKNFIIKSTIFFAKRNKKFKEIFFSEVDQSLLKLANYDFKENIISQTHVDSLKDNGIIILENVLNAKEHSEIKNDFIKNFNSNLSEKILGKKSDSIIIKKIDKNSHESSLINISNLISREIYGKSVKPSHHYLYHKSAKLPEEQFPGDNILHVDRFLPNLKIIYFPFNVDKNSAPFRYALGSHKISNEYLNFFLDNKKWIFDERNIESKKFLKDAIEVPAKENSLVIALTNGFHCRTPFREKTDRSALFFTYPSFNLISLFFPNN
tara:strand:- start:53 stop:988 length:936 start_codon:yes stop_codon:yes gene_type:complete